MPQQIAGGDIYPALEKGTIDAAEWVGPYDDEKLGFYKVAPYYYYPGWWEGGPTLHALVNLAKWNELPKNYQAIARRRPAEAANGNMMASYDTRTRRRSSGWSPAARSCGPSARTSCPPASMRPTRPMPKFQRVNPASRKSIDSQAAFRKDAYLWAQISEYTFDTFMMMQQRAGKI